MIEHNVMAQLGDRLRSAGIPSEQIWELDASSDWAGNGNDWKTNEQASAGTGQSVKGYYWTDDGDQHSLFNGRPNGHLLHHTAGNAYTPNVKNSRGQTKANVFAGLERSGRFFQSGGGVPMLALASAGPADYSSGKGVRSIMTDFLVPGVRFVGKQTARDDIPLWYGNRYYWNTEVVLDGVGGVLDSGVRELLVAYCSVLSEMLNKGPWFHLGHGQHTKRKIDLRDGRHPDMAQTMFNLQGDIALKMIGDSEPPPVEPPVEPPVIQPPPVRPPMEDQGRNQLYVKEGMSGQDVEYWQVMSIMAHQGIPFTGNSNRTFIADNAPTLTWKEWDAAMTAYLSEWTGRNSYGIGATERVMVETRVQEIYIALGAI